MAGGDWMCFAPRVQGALQCLAPSGDWFRGSQKLNRTQRTWCLKAILSSHRGAICGRAARDDGRSVVAGSLRSTTEWLDGPEQPVLGSIQLKPDLNRLGLFLKEDRAACLMTPGGRLLETDCEFAKTHQRRCYKWFERVGDEGRSCAGQVYS
jgi:hypothetical protein